MAQALLDSESFKMINLLPTSTLEINEPVVNEKPDDIQNKLDSLEGHVTVIRSHLEKKPWKMTLAMVSSKLDRILHILERNGFHMD